MAISRMRHCRAAGYKSAFTLGPAWAQTRTVRFEDTWGRSRPNGRLKHGALRTASALGLPRGSSLSVKERPVPLYRLSAPGLPVEVLAADRLVREGQHVTLYGTALVIGRPRGVVVRRCAPDVLVEHLYEPVPETSRAAWLI